ERLIERHRTPFPCRASRRRRRLAHQSPKPQQIGTTRMPTMTNFHGLIPARAVRFRPEFSIDEQELTAFARWLAAQPGVVGMMTNGHTGEVFSLTPRGRADAKTIAARPAARHCL